MSRLSHVRRSAHACACAHAKHNPFPLHMTRRMTFSSSARNRHLLLLLLLLLLPLLFSCACLRVWKIASVGLCKSGERKSIVGAWMEGKERTARWWSERFLGRTLTDDFKKGSTRRRRRPHRHRSDVRLVTRERAVGCPNAVPPHTSGEFEGTALGQRTAPWRVGLGGHCVGASHCPLACGSRGHCVGSTHCPLACGYRGHCVGATHCPLQCVGLDCTALGQHTAPGAHDVRGHCVRPSQCPWCTRCQGALRSPIAVPLVTTMSGGTAFAHRSAPGDHHVRGHCVRPSQCPLGLGGFTIVAHDSPIHAPRPSGDSVTVANPHKPSPTFNSFSQISSTWGRTGGARGACDAGLEVASAPAFFFCFFCTGAVLVEALAVETPRLDVVAF